LTKILLFLFLFTSLTLYGDLIAEVDQAFADKNLTHVREIASKECANNNFVACTKLGYLTMYYGSSTPKENHIFSRTFFKKACDGNFALGCSELGDTYTWTKGYEKVNYRKANPLWEKACNNNGADGCFSLAYSYKFGRGLKQNKSTAKELLGKACTLGNDMACTGYRELNEVGVK